MRGTEPIEHLSLTATLVHTGSSLSLTLGFLERHREAALVVLSSGTLVVYHVVAGTDVRVATVTVLCCTGLRRLT